MSISEVFLYFFYELPIHSLKCAKAQLGFKSFALFLPYSGGVFA